MEHFNFDFDLISLVIGVVVGLVIKPLWSKAKEMTTGT